MRRKEGMRALLIFTMIFVSMCSAQAEYRVYKLKITDTEKKTSREVLSILMPAAYIYYHPVRSTEAVEIVDHWMCFQRSDGFKKLCTRPFASLEQSPKAGSTERTPAEIPK